MTKFFFIIFLLCSFASVAQDTIQFRDYRPLEYKADAGETTFEVQFEPFGSNPISLNGIRARWFSTPQKAFRLNVFVGLDSDTEISQQGSTNGNLKELKNKSSVYSFNLRPGFERHLKGTDRLSPYFGMEFDLGYQHSIYKSEFQNGREINYTKLVNDNGFVRIGANLVAGFDYYVAKKLYMGTEFGFGASYTKMLAIELKSDRSGFVAPDPEKRGGSFDLGPNVNAQIRLGYAF